MFSFPRLCRPVHVKSNQKLVRTFYLINNYFMYMNIFKRYLLFFSVCVCVRTWVYIKYKMIYKWICNLFVNAFFALSNEMVIYVTVDGTTLIKSTYPRWMYISSTIILCNIGTINSLILSNSTTPVPPMRRHYFLFSGSRAEWVCRWGYWPNLQLYIIRNVADPSNWLNK